ncbi:ribosome maturation factor RimP [Zhihengliuella salsuginis]|uniref:Ribosome maturation factor RimP n=1 Tax=Zhihengliuella salsuginis TaxID=578222 RepID=A0ABQ3GHQ1_9MICC|nr:ribosome maturation factor RimP [Zhihengliuella salsuginis]GHD07479.1 ribosome maturation factor RimP [Zhihengliuella salsuginis]
MPGKPVDAQAEAQRLAEYLRPAIASHDLLLEEVEIRYSGQQPVVHVVVDRAEGTEGVDLDTIAEVSQSVSTALDADPRDTGAPYDLEVSSFGVTRPLTEPRHWRRNLGRKVTANLVGEENITGRLAEVGSAGVVLVPEIQVKKGMKPKSGDPVELDFEQIRRGKVEVEFNRPDTSPDVETIVDSNEEEA